MSLAPEAGDDAGDIPDAAADASEGEQEDAVAVSKRDKLGQLVDSAEDNEQEASVLSEVCDASHNDELQSLLAVLNQPDDRPKRSQAVGGPADANEPLEPSRAGITRDEISTMRDVKINMGKNTFSRLLCRREQSTKRSRKPESLPHQLLAQALLRNPRPLLHLLQ